MKGFLKMEKDKASERCTMFLETNMKVNGKAIKKMEKVQWAGMIHIKNILDNGLMINQQDMGIIIGLIAKFNIKR